MNTLSPFSNHFFQVLIISQVITWSTTLTSYSQAHTRMQYKEEPILAYAVIPGQGNESVECEGVMTLAQ